jgi:class 3 adenylate cyclase
VASRLSSAAGAGQILLAPESHAVVADAVNVEPIGEIQLKGMSHPIAAVNVLRLRGGSGADTSGQQRSAADGAPADDGAPARARP